MTALTTVGKVPYPVGTDALGMTDTYIKAVADWLEAQQANRVFLSKAAAQAVNSGVVTAVTFTSEVGGIDPNNLHSTAVNTSRITVSKAGRYEVKGLITYATNAAGNRHALVGKNGVGATQTSGPAAVGGWDHGQQIVAEVVCAVGDYIELMAFHTAGVALNVQAGSWVSAYWVAPA